MVDLLSQNLKTFCSVEAIFNLTLVSSRDHADRFQQPVSGHLKNEVRTGSMTIFFVFRHKRQVPSRLGLSVQLVAPNIHTSYLI